MSVVAVILSRMPAWNRTYSDDQRAAIERAGIALRIRPIAEICRMANAGELSAVADGEKLPSFKVPPSSAVSIIRSEERRQAGLQLPSELAAMAPADQAESLRRRLVGVADHELDRIEKQQRMKPKAEVDGESIRKLARAIREIATIPDPRDKRLPTVPGQGRVPGDGSQTKDDLSGSILKASDRSRAPSLDRPAGPRQDRTKRPTLPEGDKDTPEDHDTNENTATDTTNDDNNNNDGNSGGACSDQDSRVDGLASLGIDIG